MTMIHTPIPLFDFILACQLRRLYHVGNLRNSPAYNQCIHRGSRSAQGAPYFEQKNVGDV